MKNHIYYSLTGYVWMQHLKHQSHWICFFIFSQPAWLFHFAAYKHAPLYFSGMDRAPPEPWYHAIIFTDWGLPLLGNHCGLKVAKNDNHTSCHISYSNLDLGTFVAFESFFVPTQLPSVSQLWLWKKAKKINKQINKSRIGGVLILQQYSHHLRQNFE